MIDNLLNFEEKIEKLIINVFNIKKEQVNENMHIDNVINWDSLGHLSLISEIESEFSIQLDPSEISEIVDYVSIQQIVLKHIGEEDL